MKKILKKLKLFFIPSRENHYRAHFIFSNFLLGVILILFISKIIFVSFILYFPTTSFFAEVSKSVLAVLTNQTRQSVGVSILREDPRLNQAAYLKAKDMFENNYFAHTSPSGKTPWHWLGIVGYNYQYAGENLAIDFFDSEEVFQAWMNSAPHRSNIVNSKFNDVGMAVLTGDFRGRETTIVVQFFGTEMSIPAATAKEKPAPVPSPSVPKKPTPKPVPQPRPASVPAPMTLSEYYRQKGQSLPLIQERAILYESLGLGPAASYQGLAWQNALLVNKLLERDKAKEQSFQQPSAEVTLTPTPTPTPTPTLTPTPTPSPEEEPVVSPIPTTTLVPSEDQEPIFPSGELKLPKEDRNNLGFKVFNFIAQHYDGITKNIFLAVLVIVFLSVCIDLAVKPVFQPGNIILRGSIYSFVLLILFLLDKSVILKIIPHSLLII